MKTEIRVRENKKLYKRKKRLYEKYLKRVMDCCLALLGIISLLPLIIVVTVLIRVKLGSPVIFKQKRPGKDEKIFTLFKFRTMTDERDENGELLSDSDRLTKFGKFLRSTSLDELPELFNILVGDMSFIGPRPLLVKYLPLYNEYQKRRHEVKPGLSGLAQVNGRNAIDWDEKFEYDVYYVNNINFIMDLKIFYSTIIKVLAREDINQSQNETMSDFTGSN